MLFWVAIDEITHASAVIAHDHVSAKVIHGVEWFLALKVWYFFDENDFSYIFRIEIFHYFFSTDSEQELASR